MLSFSPKIKNICFDFSFFHKVRSLKDGLTFLELTASLDLFEDYHNPRFTIMLLFMNYKIFEIAINYTRRGKE